MKYTDPDGRSSDATTYYEFAREWFNLAPNIAMQDSPAPGPYDVIAAGIVIVASGALLVGVILDLYDYVSQKIQSNSKVNENSNASTESPSPLPPDPNDDDKEKQNKTTSQNQMQKQVERGKAPKEVERVDKAHQKGGQNHVHFKDGTSLNQDGSIHDAHKGVPNPSNASKEWLKNNGWSCGE